jgi:hypothetical protein
MGTLGPKWLPPQARTRHGTHPETMTSAELLASADRDSSPPPGLPPLLAALWHTRRGNWDTAHEIAQEIHSSDGSWVHALLHLIEGDTSNAAYWFARAGRPSVPPLQKDAEWLRIASHLCGS